MSERSLTYPVRVSTPRPRATSLPPSERRRAIVAALIPLLVEKGGDVPTREIAAAAGVAEGTIFRVFEDKHALLMAAAEEVMNPAGGLESFLAAFAGVEGLREKVVLAASRMQERGELIMAVMVAIRPALMALHAQSEDGSGPPMGPPPFVIEAQEELQRRLETLFEPHRGELAAPPEQAALALRSLVFGAGRHELGLGPALTPEQIADLVLDGVRKREN